MPKKHKKIPESTVPPATPGAEFVELPPLADDDLDELADFLESDRAGRNCMGCDALHGYLTAILIGPETIMPSVWLPQIWGPSDADEPEWESEAQFQHIIRLILSLCNEMVELLDFEIESFEPWLYGGTTLKGEDYLAGEQWAAAFLHGTQFWSHHLETLRSRPEGKALVPIEKLARATFWVTPAGYHKGIMKRQTYVAQLPVSVTTLHDYFMSIRERILDQKLALEAARPGTGKSH